MAYCPKLNQLVELSSFGGSFELYEEYLYGIFINTLYNHKVYYNELPVGLKRYPEFRNKESSFYHLTCKDFNNTGDENQRELDLRRCERLHWIKPAIETNHLCDCNQNCFYIYNKIVRNKERLHFLDVEDRYMVVLERRDGYYLLITAYYIEYDNILNRKIEEYERYTE